MTRPERRAGERGFTLLEVLVALIIFALLFGVLAQIFQTGMRHAGVAEAASAATALARAQLARVGVEVPLSAGEFEGETEGGLRWRTAIQRAALPAEDDAAPVEGEQDMDLVPWLVEVTVAWGPGEGEQVTLTTLRVAPVPE